MFLEFAVPILLEAQIRVKFEALSVYGIITSISRRISQEKTRGSTT